MSLPKPAALRTLKHTRAISVEYFQRDDGLWEIDARLTDTKTIDLNLRSRDIPAGTPLHDVLLRLTLDARANIVDVIAILPSVPYPGYCDIIGPAYQKMIGLNLLSGFRQGLRERLSGIEGCAHLNELAMVIPDAAVQIFDFETDRRTSSDEHMSGKKPFELDNCHALRSDGPAVALYYPRWLVNPSK